MSTNNPIDLHPTGPTAGRGQSLALQTDLRTRLDRIGIGASLLCAIHCLVAPFLLLLLPAAGSIWSHPAVHWILAVLIIPLAVWVLYNGYRKHGNKLTILAACLGTLLIVAGLISPMMYTKPIVSFTVPAFLGTSTNANATTNPASPVSDATAETCAESCCPTVTQHASGATTITMPPGGLLTLLGSLALVLAHSANLIACRCFSKNKACGITGPAPCGCPA